MRTKSILFLLTALTVLGLAGCKKEAVPVEQTELATIAPESTVSETISDKLEETKVYTAPTEVVIDENGNAVVSAETEKETLSEEELKAAQEELEKNDIGISVESADNKSNKEVLSEIDEQLKERMAAGVNESDASSETSGLEGNNSESQSTAASTGTVAYTDDQAARDALDEANMQDVREGYIPAIRSLIERKQAKGVHDYDSITDEEIAGYTDEQAMDLMVELMQ